MIRLKYKNRIESFLKNIPIVRSFSYEEGETEDEHGNIIEHERIWVYLKKGYTFASSEIGTEYMFNYKTVKNDFETIYDSNDNKLNFNIRRQ